MRLRPPKLFPTRQLPTKLNNERLAELAAVKLRALVTEHLDIQTAEVQRLGGGASCLADGEGWIYFPTTASGMLGTASIWARAHDCPQVNLIVDGNAGALAFAARGFADPVPVIWQSSGRDISRAEAADPMIEPPPDCPDLTATLVASGLEVVPDHGVWIGELNGLEVARVGSRDGECSMDIGVGAYDQFAAAALLPEAEDRADSLDRVIEMVRPHRIAGSEPHAIGRLVRSRWLRAQLVRDPGALELESLEPIPLLVERPGLMENQPAAAIGNRADGSRVLVAFTVGLDLGIGETAAGLAALHDPDEVLVVVPPRDHHQRIVDSVAALAKPALVVAVEGEWAAVSP